jgi:hypothetical protein
MKTCIRFFLGAMIVAYICACSASPCTSIPSSNGRDIIRTSGVLHKEIHWGPPNFGENPNTDSKFTAWVLHIDLPFKVKNNSIDKQKNEIVVKDIQLETSNVITSNKIAEFENKHIIVEGRLWTASTPGDVTDFNIDVTRIIVNKEKVPFSCKN